MTTRVGVVGATGRMGTAICAAVAAEADLVLASAVARSGGTTAQGVTIVPSIDALDPAGLDVVVDVSRADAARATAAWCAAHAIHAVVGTTGLTADDHARWRDTFTRSNCLVAPNFSVGAVLLMRFAEQAAPLFDSAEIIELHHDAKTDAPSGTAMLTASRMAAASDQWNPDRTAHEAIPGARGGTGPGGIHVHSVRLRGLVAHQEVILGTTGQTLTLRHDSYDVSSFMPGVLVACRTIGDHPGVTVGLDAYLTL